MTNSVLFIVSALLAYTSCAQADPLVIPYDANYEPMSFRTSAGEAAGFDVAVARELAARAQIDIEFLPVSFFEIQSGNWAANWGFAVASMSRNPERDKVFNFIGPYVFDTVVVVAANGAPAMSVADLKNVQIGVCSGCVYKAFLEGRYESDGVGGPPIPGAVPVTFMTDPDILRALTDPNSSIQYGITSAFHADYYINIGSQIHKLDPPLYFEPLWIAVPKARVNLTSALGKAFRKIADDGTLSDLSTTYLTFEYTKLPGQ